MLLPPPTTRILDPVQLTRIEATHGGFLYQHLYGVACVLMAGPLAWTRMLIEFDEDIELQFEGRHAYVQVKTRSRVIQPGDIASALDRFERYRRMHASHERTGRAEFVLVLNSEPSPALSEQIDRRQIPEDVRIIWPASPASDLPPAWPDVDAAFGWCIERAESLPFLMVAPDVLVFKLAGLMQRIASGTGGHMSHAVASAEIPGLLELAAQQLHDFPDPPLFYRPQDHEPPLTTDAEFRLVVGFSGAGKTSWAAHGAVVEGGQASAYFDVADLPSALVSVALARELSARWLRNDRVALQTIAQAALSGLEALQAVVRALAALTTPRTVVIDNAHRLAVEDAQGLGRTLRGLRLVMLAQPTADLGALSTSLGVEPEWLMGWGDDSISAVASEEGCGASMATVVRLKRLTGGLPLYVRSAIEVAKRELEGSLEALCDALELQTLTTETAQQAILSRVIDGLALQRRQVLACAALADVPLSADEMVAIAAGGFALESREIIQSLRSLRANGLMQAYGSQLIKVHDAMRPIALERLGDDPAAERRAKEELLKLLGPSLGEGGDKNRFPLFVNLLVDLRQVEKLADLGTEEWFHEVGDFPRVWPLLESASRDGAVAPDTRFEALDALLYYRQRHGPDDKVAPLLVEMEALLAQVTDLRARLVFLQKSLLYRAEKRDEPGVMDFLRRTKTLVPEVKSYRRVFAYSTALALWKLSKFDEAERILGALTKDYQQALDIDLQTLLQGPQKYATRARQAEDYGDDCKRLGDCYDLLARVLERLRRSPGPCRAFAIRLFEITGSLDSAARVSTDLVWQHVDAKEFTRARSLLEGGVVASINTHGPASRRIPIRALYAHVLGKTGDVEAARNELRAIEPYFNSLPESEKLDAKNLTDFLR